MQREYKFTTQAFEGNMTDRFAKTQWVSRQMTKCAQAARFQIDVQLEECEGRSAFRCGCALYGFVAHCCRICEPAAALHLQQAKRKFQDLIHDHAGKRHCETAPTYVQLPKLQRAESSHNEPGSSCATKKFTEPLQHGTTVIDLM